MMKRLTLTAIASFIGLSAVILVTYSYAMPRAGDEGGPSGPFLVTLELTRLGQRSFTIAVPTDPRSGEDDFVKMVDNDNGRAFGFWPEVIGPDHVEVTVRELHYDAVGDQWQPHDAGGEALEVLQVRGIGPSFTRVIEGPNNYKVRLVEIEPLAGSAGSVE